MANVEPFDNYADQYEDWFERNRFAYDSELLAVEILGVHIVKRMLVHLSHLRTGSRFLYSQVRRTIDIKKTKGEMIKCHG